MVYDERNKKKLPIYRQSLKIMVNGVQQNSTDYLDINTGIMKQKKQKYRIFVK